MLILHHTILSEEWYRHKVFTVLRAASCWGHLNFIIKKQSPFIQRTTVNKQHVKKTHVTTQPTLFDWQVTSDTRHPRHHSKAPTLNTSWVKIKLLKPKTWGCFLLSDLPTADVTSCWSSSAAVWVSASDELLTFPSAFCGLSQLIWSTDSERCSFLFLWLNSEADEAFVCCGTFVFPACWRFVLLTGSSAQVWLINRCLDISVWGCFMSCIYVYLRFFTVSIYRSFVSLLKITLWFKLFILLPSFMIIKFTWLWISEVWPPRINSRPLSNNRRYSCVQILKWESRKYLYSTLMLLLIWWYCFCGNQTHSCLFREQQDGQRSSALIFLLLLLTSYWLEEARSRLGSINSFGGSTRVSSDRDTAVTFTNWDAVQTGDQVPLVLSQEMVIYKVLLGDVSRL